MLAYALRRALLALPLLWVTVTLCFFVLRLAPGGPFDLERPLHPQVKANLKKHYHLDQPLVVQYLFYMKNVFQGDLGPSFTDFTYSVSEKIAQGWPFTLTLGAWALMIAVGLGTWSGILGALYQNKAIDYIMSFLVLLGVVVPNFVMAPLLQEYFILPVNAFFSTSHPAHLLAVSSWGEGGWQNLGVPVFVLALPFVARISRLMRASMLEVLSSNYIRTARAKGLDEPLVILRHALKPSFSPVLSFLGPAAGYLLTGSLVVETIFGLPGIGKFFINSALDRDYGMVLGIVIFYMTLIVLFNLLVDLAYAWLDPKVRLS